MPYYIHHAEDNSHKNKPEMSNGSQCVLLTVEGSIMFRNVQPAGNLFEEEERKRREFNFAFYFTTRIYNTFVDYCPAAIKARLSN